MTALQPRQPRLRWRRRGSRSAATRRPPGSSSTSGRPWAANSSGSRTSRWVCSHHRRPPREATGAASRATPAGSAATAVRSRSQTPASARVPTLNRLRHAMSRGRASPVCRVARLLGVAPAGHEGARRSPQQQSDLRVGGLSVLGDVQWHGVLVAVTNTSPASDRPAITPNRTEQSPPTTIGTRCADTAAATRALRAPVSASSAGSLIRLVSRPRSGLGAGSSRSPVSTTW